MSSPIFSAASSDDALPPRPKNTAPQYRPFMAKTAPLSRCALAVTHFRQLPSLMTAAKLEVALHRHSILTILKVTYLEAAFPIVVEEIRLNNTFSPSLFLPHTLPETPHDEPHHVAPPIILEERGDSLGVITGVEPPSGPLKDYCYFHPVEEVTVSTNCGELQFKRA